MKIAFIVALATVGADALAAPVSIWTDAIQYTGSGANECQLRGAVSFREHFRQAFDKKFAARWEGNYQLQPGEDSSNGLDDGLHVSNVLFKATAVDTRLFHFQRHYELNYDLVYIRDSKIRFVSSLGKEEVLAPEESGSQSGCEARRRQFGSALDTLLDKSMEALAATIANHSELAAALGQGGGTVATGTGTHLPLVVGAIGYRVGVGGLVVRKTPGAKGALVMKLGAGSRVAIAAKRAYGWVQIEYKGRRIGWAHPGARDLVAE
ncbi:SH3 domain-containing protein [Paludibacterium yongneupense]|uniref:SH3 domain-containing protein n=1 Tax=Paludibacterium yongneupense TaxID=400061 RepID=UPI00146C1CF8|nr:SH3 domain-containing protein [Paludibacterium yongneupense]